MKGFGIYVKNDLLEPKHYKAMEASLWLYLWLLDHITSVDEKGIGKVLGGRPIKLPEIKKDIPLSDKTYTKYVNKLVTGTYITALRTPYGYVFTVRKAVKIFKNTENRKVGVSLKERTVEVADVQNRNIGGNKEDSTQTKQILGDSKESQNHLEDKNNNMGWNNRNDNEDELPVIGDDGEVEETDAEKLKKENEKVRALLEWAEKVRNKPFMDKPTQLKHIKLLKAQGISPTDIKDTFVGLVQSDYWKNQNRLPDFKTVFSTLKNER